MAHRVDPNRGVFRSECVRCGRITDCRLVQVHDRYMWKCDACHKRGNQ